MSFLAPLFLLGGLALALPILFHLIRQTTKERTLFSSLFLLAPTPPRLTRRSRLNNILLLVLRCVVLALLAFGFARPFLSRPVAESLSAAGPTRQLLLIDRSASMHRAGLWDRAIKAANARIDKATPADQVAIYTFDREIRPVLSFQEWAETDPAQRRAIAQRRISELKPGWASARTGAALQAAAEVLADAARNETESSKRLILISDLQEGSRVEAIQGYEWPRELRLEVEAIPPAPTANAALQLFVDPDTPQSAASRPVRFRISNAPGSNKEQFQVRWTGPGDHPATPPPLEVYIPAGQSRTFTIPAPQAGAGLHQLVLSGDDEPYDNSVFVIHPEPARLAVAYLGRDQAQDPKAPLYFLMRAFAAKSLQQVSVTNLGAAASLTPGQLEACALIVATHLAPDTDLRTLETALRAGKTLFVPVTEPGIASTLGRLLSVPDLKFTTTTPPGFVMLTGIDYQHPLFAPFADPRFADFSKIRFWTYQSVNEAQLPGARILARFDSGDPALLEFALGRGRVVMLMSGWQPEQSQLALSTRFVPLLYTLLEQGGHGPPPAAQYHVGDPLPLAAALQAGPRGPTAPEVSPAPGTLNPLEPGVYSAPAGRDGGPPVLFAVNMDPSESRATSVTVDELERLGAPVSAGAGPTPAQLASRQMRLKSAELEQRQKLWRLTIILAVGILLVETWLSGRAARRIVLQTT